MCEICVKMSGEQKGTKYLKTPGGWGWGQGCQCEEQWLSELLETAHSSPPLIPPSPLAAPQEAQGRKCFIQNEKKPSILKSF